MDIKSSKERAGSSFDEISFQNVLLAYGYDKMSTIAKINVSTDVDKMLLQ